MGINGISGWNSQPYSYRIQEASAAEPEKVQSVKAEAQAAAAEAQNPRDIPLFIEEKAPAKPDTDVRELSLSFHIQEDYSYLGKDSDIEALDVQKAISDMRRDEVLQQYQYFVGDSGKLLQKASEDGLVFLKF